VTMNNYGNVSGADSSKKIALLHDAEVAKLPHFGGKDVDEMSFAHMMSVAGYIGTWEWTTAQAAGHLVFDTQLSPSSWEMAAVVDDSGTGVTGHTVGPAVSIIPRFFRYWRGGFKFKLKFVKTEFHSGRIAICFAPSTNSSYGGINLNNFQFTHRDIVDIRSLTEYEFEIPYVSITPFTPIENDIGELSIMVLNPLRAPDSVAQNIEVIVEVRLSMILK